MAEYYVEIVRTSDNIVAKRMGPFSRAGAKRAQRSTLINANTDSWFVRIVPADAMLAARGAGNG